MRETYEIEQIDVGKLGKKEWKKMVKKNVRKKALLELCREQQGEKYIIKSF